MSTIEQVLQRLVADGVEDDVFDLVVAALSGAEEVERTLGGEVPASRSEDPDGGGELTGAPHAYLASITVKGFRGIGPEATLQFQPGPGLTVVVGRNGSGKSSFAEALEVLLTGDSFRWRDKSAVWKDGWRNLHDGDDAAVSARFDLDGVPGGTVLERRWGPSASKVGDADTKAQMHGKPRTDLEGLGWLRPLDLYRPFLSHSEVGATLTDKPSNLYDAMAAILGLEELPDAVEVLRQARLPRERRAREVRQHLKDAVLPALGGSEDPRAAACHEALRAKVWDLDSVDRALAGASTDDGGVLGAVRRVIAIEVPSVANVESAAQALDQAASRLAALEGTPAEEAQRLADLLEMARSHHELHGDSPCPVCGTGTLDQGWSERAEISIADLRRQAGEYRAATSQATETVKAASVLIGSVPPVLVGWDMEGIDVSGALGVWSRWCDTPEDPAGMAGHLRSLIGPLSAETGALKNAAQAALEAREDQWRPVARAVTDWLPTAREVLAADAQVPVLKGAEGWLAGAIEAMRAERFEPIADGARGLWSQLRHHSNVDLERVALEGKNTQRHLSLDVTVDGVDGAALGVMSQGELNCLALSLFFPRATLQESPFRFVVIDDPVQAMDPARVDGLAGVFADQARDRQVIVFTHDERLPTALRRLRLPATVIEVTRRSGSRVELSTVEDPVERHLDDARALALTEQLPEGIGRRVVPGFCRLAIESAATEVVWRRRLAAGRGHIEIEEAVANRKLAQLLALALFDDKDRAGEVPGKLNSWDRAFGDLYFGVNRGVHQMTGTSLGTMIHTTERLVNQLRSV